MSKNNKFLLVFDSDEFNNIFKKINIVIKKNKKNKQLINDIFDYLLESKSHQELMEKIQLTYVETESRKNFSFNDVIKRLREYQKVFKESIYSLNINRGKRKNEKIFQLNEKANRTYNLASNSSSNPVYSLATHNGPINSSSNPVYSFATPNGPTSSSTNNNTIYNSATMNGLNSSSNTVYNLNKNRGTAKTQKIYKLFSNTYNTPQFSINSQGYQNSQNALPSSNYYSNPQIHFRMNTLRRNPSKKTTLRRTPSFHRPGEVVYVGSESSSSAEPLYATMQDNNRGEPLYEAMPGKPGKPGKPGNNRGEPLYQAINEVLTKKTNTSTPQTKRNILQKMKNGVFKRLPKFFKSNKANKAVKTPPNLSIRPSNRKVNRNPNKSQNAEYLNLNNNGSKYNELNPSTFKE